MQNDAFFLLRSL